MAGDKPGHDDVEGRSQIWRTRYHIAHGAGRLDYGAPSRGENMMKRPAALAALIALMLAGGAQGRAAAADWPTKPVKIVVAYAAGGANDLLARVFAEQLSGAFGQQFVVENRTGGGGLIGAEGSRAASPMATP